MVSPEKTSLDEQVSAMLERLRAIEDEVREKLLANHPQPKVKQDNQ